MKETTETLEKIEYDYLAAQPFDDYAQPLDDYLDDDVEILESFDINKPKNLITINPTNVSTNVTTNTTKKVTKIIKKTKSNYTDPNIYLKLDPIKNIHSNIARNIDYEHVIITRFSYRFNADKPIGNLFDADRLARRFQLFETFCLPSILSQINPNFYWIIVVDPELPAQYLDILWKHIAKFYSSSLYATRGPRQIFVHQWEYTTTLAKIDWLQKLIHLNRKYLITTRYDDDDCLCRDFTNHIADYVRKTTTTAALASLVSSTNLSQTSTTISTNSSDKSEIHGFKLISFSNGFYWYNQPSLSYGIFKSTNRPWIAIGLSFIVEREKYPMTVYFGNHTRLTQYVRNWKNHPMLKRYIELAKEEYDPKDAGDRFEVIRKKVPTYIRSVHDHNLQKNEKNEYAEKTIADATIKRASIHNLSMINQYFTLHQGSLENINSKIGATCI